MTVPSRTTEYVLMNKDSRVLRFLCSRNEFDEPEFNELEWLGERRPIGYLDLESFLDKRKAPKHRQHIKELLERYGCDDLEGFVKVTHALSLNDTFWVKVADSDLTWADVSLYRNEFDQLISEAAFDGTISDTDMSSTSPEFGTDGYYAKCWVREEGDIWLYKTGSALNVLEPFSEYLTNQLAALICPDTVCYDLGVYHDKLVSKCRLFTSDKFGLAKASAVLESKSTVPAMLAYFESIGSGDAFRRMCVLDAIALNPDRHMRNFGVLFDNDTMDVQRMAPVFDNNRSLFPELDEDQLAAPEWYIKKCRPRIGRDFIVTAKGLMTDAIRADLKNMTGFRFEQHPTMELPQNRLDLLSELVAGRVRALLE